jgi:hypothetical protein
MNKMPTPEEITAAKAWLAQHKDKIPPVLKDEAGSVVKAGFGTGVRKTPVVRLTGESQVGVANHRPSADTPDTLLPWDDQSGIDQTTSLRPTEKAAENTEE